MYGHRTTAGKEKQEQQEGERVTGGDLHMR